MNLNDVMTLKEAAERWGLNYESLRQALKRGKFEEERRKRTIRKSKGVWLITVDAMETIYGENPWHKEVDHGERIKRENPS